MRARRMIAVALLTIPVAVPACSPKAARPPAAVSTPTPTRKQADGALKAMLRAHPDAFRMTSKTISPEESDRFAVDLTRSEYRIMIFSESCRFDYEGRFALEGGTWIASQPELRSIGMYRR